MGRRRARESTMKLLYQMDINKEINDEAIDLFLEENNCDKKEKNYILDSIKNICDNKDTIDSYVRKYASGWKLDRIAKVDLSILRIAIYEILFREDIPLQVSINEAIEVSKKYSSSESSKFINGLLGSFVRDMENDEK